MRRARTRGKRRARTVIAHRRSASIYLSPNAIAAIEDRIGLEPSDRSETCSVIIERYAEIVAANKPDFSEEEWAYLCATGPGGIAAWAAGAGGMAEEYGVSVEALAERIRRLPLVARVAAIDEVERRWARFRRMERDLTDSIVYTRDSVGAGQLAKIHERLSGVCPVRKVDYIAGRLGIERDLVKRWLTE